MNMSLIIRYELQRFLNVAPCEFNHLDAKKNGSPYNEKETRWDGLAEMK